MHVVRAKIWLLSRILGSLTLGFIQSLVVAGAYFGMQLEQIILELLFFLCTGRVRPGSSSNIPGVPIFAVDVQGRTDQILRMEGTLESR